MQATSAPGHPPPVISNSAQRKPPILLGNAENSRGPDVPTVNLYHNSLLDGVVKHVGFTEELLMIDPGELKSTLLQILTALLQLLPGEINPVVELIQSKKSPSAINEVTENQICVPVAVENAAEVGSVGLVAVLQTLVPPIEHFPLEIVIDAFCIPAPIGETVIVLTGPVEIYVNQTSCPPGGNGTCAAASQALE